MRSQWIRPVGVAFLVVLLGSGCSRYILVESTVTRPVPRLAPDVTEAQGSVDARKRIRTIGLVGPESCSVLSRQAAPAADKSGAVDAVDCRAEVAELERFLAARGYAVLSWDNLRRMVQTNGMTVLQAARSLGADMVLQIDALKRFREAFGSDASWRRNYHSATVDGGIVRPASGYAGDVVGRWKSLASPNEALLMQRTRVGIVIALSAVRVDTGEAVWFYRTRLAAPDAGEASCRTLVAGKGDRWRRIDSKKGTGAAQSADPGRDDEMYHQLVRAVAEDVVQRFTTW